MISIEEVVLRLEEMRRSFQGLTSRGVVNFLLDELSLNPYYRRDPMLLKNLILEALRLLREDLEEIKGLEEYLVSLANSLGAHETAGGSVEKQVRNEVGNSSTQEG